MKKLPFILMVILALLTSTGSACFSMEAFLPLQDQDGIDSPNPSPPSNSSWIFLDLPLGRYRFDTGLRLDQMNQSRVSPAENDHPLELQALTLQFSLKW
jgi:hypothetical protein